MTSPTLESFCCLDHHDLDNLTSRHHDAVFTAQSFKAYNYICIVCGSLGIVGCLYQLFPRKPSTLPHTQRAFQFYTRQNIIICFLALADLLATIGIVARSSFWLQIEFPGRKFNPLFSNSTIQRELKIRYLSCAILSGWIQYFYICTYCWTMCYAIDIYRLLQDKTSSLNVYHVICWGLSFIITAGGLVTLYFPSLLECVYDTAHLLPNFLSAYAPIMAVMLLNPVLYWKAAKAVKESIMLRTGQYTDQERAIVKSVRRKFYMVSVVFFVCWGPNILNSILHIFRHRVHPDIFIAVWMAMAVLNPLQGFLNSLVYQGAGGFNIHLRRESINFRPGRYRSFLSRTGPLDEDTTLLSYRGAR